MILEYCNNKFDLRPTKIIAVARNYRAHAEEMGSEIPEEPKLFLKPPSSLIGDGGTVILPKISKRVDYEVELAIIAKDRMHKVSAEESKNHILGYTVVVDVTARDIQNEAKKQGMPWTIAKGYDTFAPVGPSIVAADKINPDNLNIWLKVNGIIKQKGNTKDMIFSIGELVSYISKIMTIEPMDIIATGTPEGIGPMSDGDFIEAEIEGIGVLKFKVEVEKDLKNL